MFANPTQDRLRSLLAEARTIAVLGAHHDEARPAFYVPEYLVAQGYRVLPINPAMAGQTLLGQPVHATLAELRESVDVVDVFRRGDLVPQHLDDLLAMQPLPKTVWLQLGVRNDDVAQTLQGRGIEVVQDRCMLADHRNMGVGRVA